MNEYVLILCLVLGIVVSVLCIITLCRILYIYTHNRLLSKPLLNNEESNETYTTWRQVE